MASSPAKRSNSSSIFFLLLAFVVFSAGSFSIAKAEETRIRIYFHEVVAGPNQTSYSVASLHRNSSSFGDIRVFDNALTEGPEPGSKLIGRGQGMSTVVSDDFAMMGQINFVFTAGEFNGSSLAMFGVILRNIDTPPTIVGGSGRFRMARGYVERKLLSSSASEYAVQFDFYVWH